MRTDEYHILNIDHYSSLQEEGDDIIFAIGACCVERSQAILERR
jgi:hypothetical protein